MPEEAMRPQLEDSWMEAVGGEFTKPYMHALKQFLVAEIALGKEIYPLPRLFFAAMNRTPLSRVKAVILGQDPYFNPGQAHGFSFSVPPGVAKPPSLRNILQELESDLGIPLPRTGCLEAWADGGVLLLNTALSVERGLPNSHAKRGWATFTDRVIQAVSERPGHVAFVLWGAHARSKATLVDRSRHLVHQSAHPSPLAASGGFFGSRPFSKVNAFLHSKGISPIDWRLPDPTGNA